MHMHAPDQHLPSPPLSAFDQLRVARGVGEFLGRPLRERVGAGAEQFHAALAHHRIGGGQRRMQIVHRLGHIVTDPGDHLNGVAQQLLMHAGIVSGDEIVDRWAIDLRGW